MMKEKNQVIGFFLYFYSNKMAYKKLIYLLISYCCLSSQALTLNQMEINIINSKLKNNFSIQLTNQFCKYEDPGLDIDSDVADYLFFKKKCKCSINSGRYTDISESKNFFYNCIQKK